MKARTRMEKVDLELKRLWQGEIRDFFRAEGEFLRNYGSQAGYEEGYIRKVLEDHERLESLARRAGKEGAAQFSRVLLRHLRFKDEYMVRHLERLAGIEPGPALGDPSLN